MIVMVDIKEDYALTVLKGLEKIGAIDIKESNQNVNDRKNKAYEAVQIDLKGYHFNREEANER